MKYPPVGTTSELKIAVALKYLTKTILYKRKYKIERRSQFIEDFVIFIKQCYHVV